eukprot:gnl/TRDRNA2_/TRDRNA2_180675_c0_seq1.p1 gnl/TRDRNA2_/TRDRNA2_180675_c0~~gnl/TRDRNA2_/TRDRNA2_180675_c0_seq1.p1  ORF type:complete len:263 (-),score=50.29 gnl/TRDRNA2_/TRDRNA2_180675_c0_seq1:80-868(-)
MECSRLAFIKALLVAVAFTLQGCDHTDILDAPRHNIGHWQSKDNYLTKYEFIAPGANSSTAVLNSCQSPSVPDALKCDGHGKCVEWVDIKTGDVQAPRLSFCECDAMWADPECRTPRKSQITAFILSIFGGVLGIDQFYLGYIWYGLLKLVTLGGFGIWYIFDIIRIGSGPVLTFDRDQPGHKFKVANDLAHEAFVLAVIVVTLAIGFAISIYTIFRERSRRAREVLLLRTEEELRRSKAVSMQATPRSARSFYGYGAALPA